MAARGARRGMSAREREATVQMHGQRDRVRDARGSGKPSPHDGCAMPCTGRPREREPAAARRPHGPGTGERPRVMREPRRGMAAGRGS